MLHNLLTAGKTLLEETVTPGAGLDFSEITNAVSGIVTPQQIITYIAGAIVACGTVYIAWIFGRKAVSWFLNAVNGRKPMRG